MNLQKIKAMTIEYGEGWAITHLWRVLGLVNLIGEKMPYDHDLVQYAAYLHDWGAFPRFQQPGVDHARCGQK